jgi:uncharacterized protein YkwD
MKLLFRLGINIAMILIGGTVVGIVILSGVGVLGYMWSGDTKPLSLNQPLPLPPSTELIAGFLGDPINAQTVLLLTTATTTPILTSTIVFTPTESTIAYTPTTSISATSEISLSSTTSSKLTTTLQISPTNTFTVSPTIYTSTTKQSTKSSTPTKTATFTSLPTDTKIPPSKTPTPSPTKIKTYTPTSTHTKTQVPPTVTNTLTKTLFSPSQTATLASPTALTPSVTFTKTSATALTATQITPTQPVESCNYSNHGAWENQLHVLINQFREENGVPPLVLHSQLRGAAREHSMDMACNNYVSHTGTDGSSSYQRILSYGYTPSWWGENIYMGWNTTPEYAFNWWINSTPHLNNLLSPYYRQIGVGHAQYGNRSAFTLVFGTP